MPFRSSILVKVGFKAVQTGVSIVKINTNVRLELLSILFIYS